MGLPAWLTCLLLGVALVPTVPLRLASSTLTFQKFEFPNSHLFCIRARFRFVRNPVNPTQLTDEQCLTIWNCCFDPDLRKGVPLEYVPDCIRTCLGPRASGNIHGLERLACKLRKQYEADLATQLEHWARE